MILHGPDLKAFERFYSIYFRSKKYTFMEKRAAGAIFLDVCVKFIDFMKKIRRFYFKQINENEASTSDQILVNPRGND